MPSVRQIKRRIRSVQNTSKITKAMSMIAASKMRRTQEAALEGRPYSENMIVIEVASEKSHQSVKKYCDQTQRDVTRKGFTLSNLLSLSILDQLK